MNKQTVAALLSFLLWTAPVGAVKVGEPFPDCAVTPIGDRQQYPLRQLKGKVLYVDFWASWCAPCAESFPFLNALNEKYKEQGLTIVGINMDERSEDAQTFIAEFSPNFMIVADSSQQCAKAFDVKAMPSSYLIDRGGVVRHIHLGFKRDEADEIERMVRQVLAEPKPKPSGGQ